MRKIVFILVAVMLIIQPVIASEHTRKMETAADADSWIRVFLGDDPASLDGAWEMTAQMETATAMLGGTGGMASSLAKLGEVVEIGSAYEGELMG